MTKQHFKVNLLKLLEDHMGICQIALSKGRWFYLKSNFSLYQGVNGVKCVPVILAGGSGTRLWPLSRKSFPNSSLNLWARRRCFNLLRSG